MKLHLPQHMLRRIVLVEEVRACAAQSSAHLYQSTWRCGSQKVVIMGSLVLCRGGVVPARLNRDVTGPIARTVRDAAVLFEAMVGYDQRDGLTELALVVSVHGRHNSKQSNVISRSAE